MNKLFVLLLIISAFSFINSQQTVGDSIYDSFISVVKRTSVSKLPKYPQRSLLQIKIMQSRRKLIIRR